MRYKITKQILTNIIGDALNEALKYDGNGTYYPNFTGNTHSDAGKYVDYNGGKPWSGNQNYARNDYKWSDEGNKAHFDKLQRQNGLDKEYRDADYEGGENAAEFWQKKDGYKMAMQAAYDMEGEAQDMMKGMVKNLCKTATERYPFLKSKELMSDFLTQMRDSFQDALYDIL